ncbi:MAG: lamin tail domain-containing protein [Myxococcota bacterium]
MGASLAITVGLIIGTSGCFQDTFMMPEDDDDTPVGTTSGGTVPADSGGDTVSAETEDAVDGTDDAATTTGVDTTGDDTTDTGEEDSGSTSDMVDDSTGEEVVLSVDELLEGDLVISEVMWNPTCAQDTCEWLEVYNATAHTVNLLDLFVQDNNFNPGNQGRITTDLLVESGDVVVITRGVDFWPYDFGADGIYGPQPGFTNSSPERAVLVNAGGIIDQTWFFDIDQEEGIAWSLSGVSLDAVSNDDPDSWCLATDELPTFTDTEYGTPGQLNPPC